MAIKKRVSRQLNDGSGFNKIDNISDTKITKDNLVDVLLSLEDKDITTSLIMNLFGEFNGKSLCNPYDILVIPAGIYGKIHKKPNKNNTYQGWKKYVANFCINGLVIFKLYRFG